MSRQSDPRPPGGIGQSVPDDATTSPPPAPGLGLRSPEVLARVFSVKEASTHKSRSRESSLTLAVPRDRRARCSGKTLRPAQTPARMVLFVGHIGNA
jgi:hypothetical protein